MRQNKGDHYLPIRRYFFAFRAMSCSGGIVRSAFLIMIKEEKIKRELEKLYEYRRQALKRNDLMWMVRNNAKIKEKEAELEECKKYHPMRLKDILDDKGEDVKNKVYKTLLKISLAADYVNDCVVEAKEVMKELGLNDFTLRTDAEELCKLSQKIASFVIIPNQHALTDMMVENEKFISRCHQAANTHLKRTLNL